MDRRGEREREEEERREGGRVMSLLCLLLMLVAIVLMLVVGSEQFGPCYLNDVIDLVKSLSKYLAFHGNGNKGSSDEI